MDPPATRPRRGGRGGVLGAGAGRVNVSLVSLDPTVDKTRLTKRLAALDAREATEMLDVLGEFFTP